MEHKRVLITGATGFIGTHLLRLLQNENYDLALLVRHKRNAGHLLNKNVRFIEADLSQIHVAKKEIKDFDPEICVHLAWSGIPDYHSTHIAKQNLFQSIDLIDLLTAETSCRKIIACGSCSEYGKTDGECLETEPPIAHTALAWAKIAICHYLSLIAKTKSVDFIWLRLFYVYGPGQRKDGLLPTILDAFRQNEEPDIRNPSNAYDFVYVEDVANLLKLGLEKDVESGIYNVGTGRPTHILNICQMAAKLMNCSVTFPSLPQTQDDTGVCFLANIKKTVEKFGWYPKYALNDGIEAMRRVYEIV